jgi:hypothetical protein
MVDLVLRPGEEFRVNISRHLSSNQPSSAPAQRATKLSNNALRQQAARAADPFSHPCRQNDGLPPWRGSPTSSVPVYLHIDILSRDERERIGAEVSRASSEERRVFGGLTGGPAGSRYLLLMIVLVMAGLAARL